MNEIWTEYKGWIIAAIVIAILIVAAIVNSLSSSDDDRPARSNKESCLLISAREPISLDDCRRLGLGRY